MEVGRVDLANWTFRTSPKFTTGVKYQFLQNMFECFVSKPNVQLAKWITGKRKQPRPGHLLVLSLCGRVIEGVMEITNRRAAE